MVIRYAQIVGFLILVVCATQIVEIQVKILGTVISVEEIGMILGAGIIMATGEWPKPPAALIVFALIDIAIQTNYYFFVGNYAGVVVEIIRNIIMLVIFSTIHNALVRDEARWLQVLAKCWIGLSLASSVIIILQAIGVLPMVAMVQGALKFFPRPPGLQNDPNYAAYSLGAAMIFLWALRAEGRVKIACGGVLLVGLVLTDSRMGLLFALLIAGYVWLHGLRRMNRGALVSRVLVAFGGAVAIAMLLMLSSISNTPLYARLGGAVDTVSNFSLRGIEETKGLQRESSKERLLAAYGGIRTFQDNFWTGVGKERMADELWKRVGIRKATHNAYVDRLVIGGATGFLYVLFIGYIMFRSSFMFSGKDRVNLADIVPVTILVFAIGSFFLNLSFWLPVAMYSAARAEAGFTLLARRGAWRGTVQLRT